MSREAAAKAFVAPSRISGLLARTCWKRTSVPVQSSKTPRFGYRQRQAGGEIRRSHLALDCGRPGRGLRGCTCGRCVDQPVGLPRRVSALAPDWRRSGASRSAARTLSSSPSSALILASAISTFVSRAATCRINFLNLPIDVGAARRLWAGRDYHASPLPRRALSTGSAASASLAARSFAITGLRSNSATSGSWAGLGSSPSALAAQSMINRATDPSGAVGAEGVDPLRHCPPLCER